MYLDKSTITKDGKTYRRVLLRSSYREDGKVKHSTVANLSSCCNDEELRAIEFALKNKKNLGNLFVLEEVSAILGKRIGAVWVVIEVMKRLGIAQILGNDRAGKLAQMQVVARIIDQGSRLSAVRFAEQHAVCEILGIPNLDENDLYENLRWLSEQQESIEKKLFQKRTGKEIPTLFLYDVTSSYLEGEQNALGAYGYNRDGKRGKLQIVVGLLTDGDGIPVAVRVFEGNTNDHKTVSEQIRILSKTFGVKNVTLVGDRGMIKGPQIEDLPDDFSYITAITKPQIQKKLSSGTFQLELFNDKLCEVVEKDIRYVLRRNPVRACELAKSRESKLEAVDAKAKEQTTYLLEHPKANPKVALKKVTAKINRLKIEEWCEATLKERVITVSKNEATLAEAALLDGCYVIKSNVPTTLADTQTIHDRYCSLEQVERDFRTMKTTHLELRAIYVRKEESTRGHVFVVMLALLVQRELEKAWAKLDLTVEEGPQELSAVSMQEIVIGQTRISNIPTPTKLGLSLLNALSISLPTVLPFKQANVHTTKKLPSERKRA